MVVARLPRGAHARRVTPVEGLAVRHRVEALAALDVPVLLIASTTSDAVRTASVLHAASARASAPLVEFSGVPSKGCSEGAVFARLFDGLAAVLEAARGGTVVFLDVDGLTLAAQAKLTLLLTTGEYHPIDAADAVTVDVRIVATTTADLAALIDRHRFRRDLYELLAPHIIGLTQAGGAPPSPPASSASPS